ncbi:MAG: hypothetical protein DCC58_00945 [Chloroflexi bacterium]|nr:MAG: hypothetical protein DCC58_00945 [Chloroflexota bacterium]
MGRLRANRLPARAARAALAGLLLVLAFAALAPNAVAAQPARFLRNSAEPNFPETLTFRLQVESDTTIEQVELYWRPARGETLSLALPEFQPGHRVEVEHEIDMAINYLPPGLDLIWFWRVTDADGVVSDSEPQSVLYMDGRHDWRSRTDGLVTLYWYNGNDAFAQSILDSANATVSTLRDRFQVSAEEEIRLVIYGSNADFSKALPPNSADWIGGQAYSDLHLIVAALAPGGGSAAEIGRMIPHEVSHLVVHQATRNPFNAPPNWLDEGLAVYNQDTVDTRLQPMLDRAVRDGRLMTVRALNSSFPLDPDEALLSYAASESIVRFVIERWGDAGIARLLGSFRNELSYEQALQFALNISFEELDAQWKAWLGYPGDAPPEGPASGGEVDFGSPGWIAVIGGAIALITLLVVFGIVAFVLAYRAHRGAQSRG